MALATGAIVGGAVAAAGTVTGAVIGGNAASSAADKQAASQQSLGQKQLDFAQKQMDAEKASRAEAVATVSGIAQKSYGEMSSIQSLLQTKQQGLSTALAQLDKESSILEATDPVIKAAGKQLQDMIAGKAAETLAPIRAENDRQRQNLEASLSAKLGPGWRTSSAGIEASSRFEATSLQTLSQAQLSAMQTVSNVFQQAGTVRPKDLAAQASDIFKTAQSADATALSAEQNISNRMTDAYLKAETGNQVNFGAMTGAAGQQVASPPLVGQGGMIQAGVTGGMFGDLGKIGAGVATSVFPNNPNPLSSSQSDLVNSIKNLDVGANFGSMFGK